MASSNHINVQLSNLGGRYLEVRMNVEATFADLKLRAYVAWQLPPLCQEFLVGADIMENTAKLLRYRADVDQPLQVTVIVRLDSAKEKLDSYDAFERKEAVEAMAFVANREDAAFQSIVNASADEESQTVQAAALEVLVKLAAKGEGPRIEQILKCICTECARVDAKAAVRALTRIAPKGHQGICEQLKMYGEEMREDFVVCTSISAFCNIAIPDDEIAISWVLDLFGTHDAAKIGATVASDIILLAPRGHEGVVQKLLELTDPVHNDTVRLPALMSLQKCAASGDLKVVACAVICAKSQNVKLTHLAVQVLGQLAPFGHQDACEVLAACLAHKHRGVRRSAAQALGRISPKGDEQIVAGMLKHFQYYVEGSVARNGEGTEIGEMLQHLAEKGDARVISSVFPYLDSLDDWVKQAAIEVLGFVAAADDERTISACIEATKLSIAPVAQAAVAALMRIAGLQHEPGTAAACHCLKHRDSWVRRSTAEAFSEATGKGNEAVVRALCICCKEDTDSEVLQKAADALANIAERGDGEVVAVLSLMLEHRDEWSRRAGAAAMARVAAKGDTAAIEALLSCLEDDPLRAGDDIVLELSLKAIANIANRGDAKVIDAILSCLDHKTKAVREASLLAFEQIVAKGDSHAIASLLQHLTNSKAVVKVVALRALGMVLTQENQDTLPMLYDELAHPKPIVRQTALEALQRITGVMETEQAD